MSFFEENFFADDADGQGEVQTGPPAAGQIAGPAEVPTVAEAPSERKRERDECTTIADVDEPPRQKTQTAAAPSADIAVDGDEEDEASGDESQEDPLPAPVDPQVAALLLRVAQLEAELTQRQDAHDVATAASRARIEALEGTVTRQQGELDRPPSAASPRPSTTTSDDAPLLSLQLELAERTRVGVEAELEAIQTYSEHTAYVARKQAAVAAAVLCQAAVTASAVPYPAIESGEGEDQLDTLLGGRAALIGDAVKKFLQHTVDGAASVSTEDWERLLQALVDECLLFARRHDELLQKFEHNQRLLVAVGEKAAKASVDAIEAKLAQTAYAVETATSSLTHQPSNQQVIAENARLQRRLMLLESTTATLLAEKPLAPQRVVPQVVKEVRLRNEELERDNTMLMQEVLLLRRMLSGANTADAPVLQCAAHESRGEVAAVSEMLQVCLAWYDRVRQATHQFLTESADSSGRGEAAVLQAHLFHAMAHIRAQNTALRSLQHFNSYLITQAAEVGTLRHFLESSSSRGSSAVDRELLNTVLERLASLDDKLLDGGLLRRQSIIAQELSDGALALRTELEASFSHLDDAYGAVLAKQAARIAVLCRTVERADACLMAVLQAHHGSSLDGLVPQVGKVDIDELLGSVTLPKELQTKLATGASAAYSVDAGQVKTDDMLLAKQSELHKQQLNALTAGHIAQVNKLNQRVADLSKGKKAQQIVHLEQAMQRTVSERDNAKHTASALTHKLQEMEKELKQLAHDFTLKTAALRAVEQERDEIRTALTLAKAEPEAEPEPEVEVEPEVEIEAVEVAEQGEQHPLLETDEAQVEGDGEPFAEQQQPQFGDVPNEEGVVDIAPEADDGAPADGPPESGVEGEAGGGGSAAPQIVDEGISFDQDPW